jgi:hypothetical protein
MARTGPVIFGFGRAPATLRAVMTIALIAASGLGTVRAASATAVDLGDAANYGILTGQKEAVTFGGRFNLSGNLGIGKSSTVKFTGNTNAIAGTEYKDSSVTTSGSATIAGGVVTTSMTNAINDAVSASNAAGDLSGAHGLVDQGGSISVNGGNITIKALSNLSENVLNISSLSLLNGTITFDDNGFTGAKFIINVTGDFSINSTGSKSSMIKGINGASADDILFNIEGTGDAVSITGNSSNQIIGTILAPQRNVSVGGGGSLTGAIIAGVDNANKSYTLTSSSSGFNVTASSYTPSTGGGSHVPEPSSMALYGGGLAALFALRRGRRKGLN